MSLRVDTAGTADYGQEHSADIDIDMAQGLAWVPFLSSCDM